MKLYRITRNRCGYDEYDAHLVLALSEKEARKEASKVTGDESFREWIDPSLSRCEQIKLSGQSRILLSSFLAG